MCMNISSASCGVDKHRQFNALHFHDQLDLCKTALQLFVLLTGSYRDKRWRRQLALW